MNNIVSNAIKYSPKNATITIQSEVSPKRVQIHVEDEGVGIPDALISKVFSDDEVTGRRGTEGEPGTGFGLPIVKAMVEAMEGKVSIESREGGGVRVTVVLPAG